jgi:vacuolar-type H+-ATPase subunit E/Vma4
MSLETIITRIDEDTDSEIRSIQSECDNRIRKIASDGRKTADREYARILADGKREIRAAVKKILSQASMDARRTVRVERESGISHCFMEAENALTALAGTSGYRQILENLIGSGLAELGAEEVFVVCTERDRTLVAALIKDRSGQPPSLTLLSECAIAAGGVILRSKSGKITINNTFEARRERLQDDLLFGVATILYGR